MSSGEFVDIADRPAFNAATRPSVLQRLVSRRGVTLLARNTVVSILTFVVGLALMWMLVEWAGANKVFSAGASFLAATSLHYVFGRSWVFRGTERGVATGYGYFLINATIGMTLTVSIFAALISWTPMNYLIARILVSIFAGLAMFVLNATLNFKQL
jgi:putative flippase GtrA